MPAAATKHNLPQQVTSFVGRTREPAEAAGAGGEVDPVDVLDLLSELSDKSLVTMEPERRRYRPLDTVHEYARERLDESGDTDKARRKHLAFYLTFAEAGLAAFLGEWRRAAQLYGAADLQFEQSGFHREPADEAFHSPLIAQAREALGAAGFAAVEAAGRALSYDTATAEARAWLENPS